MNIFFALKGSKLYIIIPNTAFITKYGLYEHCTIPMGLRNSSATFQRCVQAIVHGEHCTIPMGLRNSSATFQRCVQAIVHGINWVSCLVYLDDIIVFADTFQEHADRVDMVLSRLKSAGLRLKASKCSIFSETAHFLGHILTSQGVLPSPSNVARIMQFTAPENPT